MPGPPVKLSGGQLARTWPKCTAPRPAAGGRLAESELSSIERAPNIVIAEALDRSLHLADFSNVGGHISAPGTDVMSTAPDNGAAICSGTSFAAAHVAALALILFELDPTLTAAQVAQLTVETAAKAAEEGVAPRIDALAAVLKLHKSNIELLVDLDEDGTIGEKDIQTFARQLAEYKNEPGAGTTFAWRLSDFDGDGRIGGGDLAMLRSAWGGPESSLHTEVERLGLSSYLTPAAEVKK
jgi:hypothetical protein